MLSFKGGIYSGSVNVMTSEEGGLSTEQITDMAMERLIMVSETAPPAIQQQAKDFKNSLRAIMFNYLDLARREERATIAQKMAKNGNSEMADLVRRI